MSSPDSILLHSFLYAVRLYVLCILSHMNKHRFFLLLFVHNSFFAILLLLVRHLKALDILDRLDLFGQNSFRNHFYVSYEHIIAQPLVFVKWQ